MNNSYREKFKDSNDTIIIYQYFSNVPFHNFLTSILYIFILTALLAGISFYEYKIQGTINLAELKILAKVIALSLTLVIALYSITSYLVAEHLTKKERSQLYTAILNNGLLFPQQTRISIRGKFLFIIVLFIVILLTLAAIMKDGGLFAKYNTYVLISHFSLSILVPLVLMLITLKSIVTVLQDLKTVTRQISYKEKTVIKAVPMEKEIADIEYSLLELALENDEYSQQIETKIVQKSEELQDKSQQLEDAVTHLEMKDLQMQKQLDMAKLIQRNTLPTNIENWYELKFSMRYHAIDQIGGDFYDIYQIKDNKLGIIIADVSGHGIPASLVTAVAKTTFSNARLNYDSPRKIFQEANHNILQYIKSQDYMSCFMVVFDDEYNFVYSNASHQKAILMHSDGSTEMLDTEGLFIGALSDSQKSYQEKRGKLTYGDRLILYTDGIPQALSKDHKEYSIERLQQLVIDKKALPLEEFTDALLADVKQHIGTHTITDDMTLLVTELAFDETVDIIKQANKLVEAHKYYEAIELLEQGEKKYPDNNKILYNLGKNYFRINNYSKAINVLETYIEKDRHNKYAYYICGTAYYQLMDYAQSIELFLSALRIDSNFVNPLFALAMSYKKKGDMKKAIRTFEKVISIDPANKMALFEIKQINEQTGHTS